MRVDGESIDMSVVPLSAQDHRNVDGHHVHVPRAGVDCPVLNIRTIRENLFIPVEGRQLSFNDEWRRQKQEEGTDTSPDGSIDVSVGTGLSLPDTSALNEELTVDKFQERANGCADGTCPFIGKIATCWRRPEKVSTTD